MLTRPKMDESTKQKKTLRMMNQAMIVYKQRGKERTVGLGQLARNGEGSAPSRTRVSSKVELSPREWEESGRLTDWIHRCRVSSTTMLATHPAGGRREGRARAGSAKAESGGLG